MAAVTLSLLFNCQSLRRSCGISATNLGESEPIIGVQMLSYRTREVPGPPQRVRVEADRDGDGKPDGHSRWRDVYHGRHILRFSSLPAARWRLRFVLSATKTSGSPRIRRVTVTPHKTR